MPEYDHILGCFYVERNPYTPTPSEKVHGNLIKAGRMAKHWTMLDAANAVGCTIPQWSAWERGGAPPPDDAMWQKIVDVLGL